MAVEKARFLGYDPAGEAVFQDLAYASDAPKSWIAGTSFPELNSPDVFRLSSRAAETDYGKGYDTADEYHPHLSGTVRVPLAEQELAETAAEFDKRFGLTTATRGVEGDRDGLVQRTKEFISRAGDRAIAERAEELERQTIYRESAAFHGGWVPGDPTEEQKQQLRADYERRQEWNELIRVAPVDGREQTIKDLKPPAEMTQQEILNEARAQHTHFLQLHEQFEQAQGAERAQIREELKPIATRENELRDEFIGRRKEEALTEFLEKIKLPSKNADSQKIDAVRDTEQDAKPENSRSETIRQLRAFARNRAELPYVQAEVAIATNLADQLEAGAKNIDLSQRYWTRDPAAAEERHRRALENLGPVLRQAERQTERLDYGKAIAHGTKQREVLAVSNHDIKRGLANTAGLLQNAANHNHHVVEAPRLSISEGLGGGL